MITRIIFFVFILLPFAADAQMVVGRLGVSMEPCLTGCGLIITEIIPGSAADYAGLHPGDILVQINGENVYDDMTGVRDYIKSNPDAIAALTISRDGSIMPVDVRFDAFAHDPFSPVDERSMRPPPLDIDYDPSPSTNITNYNIHLGNIKQENKTIQHGTGNMSNPRNRR